MIDVINGDSRIELKKLIDKGIQVDSVVTDPPYELGFMGKTWDSTGIAFDPEFWKLCLRILKPGGHLLAFAGARTYHGIAYAIEKCGFEIRDQVRFYHDSLDDWHNLFLTLSEEQALQLIKCLEKSPGSMDWIYGTGFPKGLNISRAIDEKYGIKKERDTKAAYKAETPLAIAYDGWKTQLKPAFEPIAFARKPMEGDYADNIIKYGVGALNIDACRVATDELQSKFNDAGTPGEVIFNRTLRQDFFYDGSKGRYPADIITDGSEEVINAFPDTHSAGAKRDVVIKQTYENNLGTFNGIGEGDHRSIRYGDAGGSAARFFYAAKATTEEKNGSKHPTIKPLDLMKYLVKLVTPKGGLVLDPFAGSGTTGVAAKDLDMNAILIEREKPYYEDIQNRLKAAENIFDLE